MGLVCEERLTSGAEPDCLTTSSFSLHCEEEVKVSSIRYVGHASSRGTDIISRLRLNNLISTAVPSRTTASSDVVDAAATYATKTYVDGQDALFQLPSYYQDRDALHIPLAAKGQPNGVASLDDNGKIPVSQIPALGSGYLSGPFGPTVVYAVSASNTPLKIAEWEIGVESFVFQPLAFATVLVSSPSSGRPVVEIRMSDGQQPYESQTRIGIGMGYGSYVDTQPVAVVPAAASTGQSGTAADWPGSTDIWATAWLYDLSQTSTVAADGVFSASIFLMRTAQ